MEKQYMTNIDDLCNQLNSCVLSIENYEKILCETILLNKKKVIRNRLTVWTSVVFHDFAYG